MSRTYRKNLRLFEHYKGDYYSCYNNKSLKADFSFKSSLWEGDIFPECSPSRFKAFVKVGDGENYGKGMGKKWKRIFIQIDRANYRNVLKRVMKDGVDNGIFITPSYDAWYYD